MVELQEGVARSKVCERLRKIIECGDEAKKLIINVGLDVTAGDEEFAGDFRRAELSAMRLRDNAVYMLKRLEG